MKRLLLTALTAAICGTMNAQVTLDTVSVGGGYANQVWYSLSADVQGSAPKNNWDLAFDASGYGSTIMINSVAGTMLWAYPNADITGWASVDTTGLSTWTPRYNSDTSWGYGAMGRYADLSNPYDLDWGLYNVTTHVITGDSIYIIKLGDGQYKKLKVTTLSGGIYSFDYANVDGTSPQTATLDKAAYSGKNFGYYSLQTNAALDREPASANWDIVFTQYTAFIPQAYTVTGVLSNAGVTVAKCTGVTGKDTFANWAAQTFVPAINTLGYNWKTFNGSAYTIQDSAVFFVARSNGEIWKMIFTGFSGGTNGDFMFSKQKLYTPPPAAVSNVHASETGIAIYPNPAVGSTVHIVYNIQVASSQAQIEVRDMTGKLVYAAMLEGDKGLHQYDIPASSVGAGMYVVTLQTANTISSNQLVIQ